MKFILSVAVYLGMAVALAWGILSLFQPSGKPWLLIGAIAAYTVLFARIGCASEQH